jgi:NAD(P)-dependent dehydrogenase (short-subunit alcohol dehydrogenase family)
VVAVDLDADAGKAAADEVGGAFVPATSPTSDGRARCSTASPTLRPVDIAFNNAGISPPDDDSILDTGLDAWDGCSGST